MSLSGRSHWGNKNMGMLLFQEVCGGRCRPVFGTSPHHTKTWFLKKFLEAHCDGGGVCWSETLPAVDTQPPRWMGSRGQPQKTCETSLQMRTHPLDVLAPEAQGKEAGIQKLSTYHRCLSCQALALSGVSRDPHPPYPSKVSYVSHAGRGRGSSGFIKMAITLHTIKKPTTALH